MISLILQIIFWIVALIIAIAAILYVYNVVKCMFGNCASDDWDYDD